MKGKPGTFTNKQFRSLVREHMTNTLSRRKFLGNVVQAGTGLTILCGSASARAYLANEKLNIAVVGCGTRGRHFVEAIPRIGENLVAMCDVNEQRAARAFQMAPDVPKHYDYSHTDRE